MGAGRVHATGVLKDYDATDRLGAIRVAVLLTAGRYDEAVPETVECFQSAIPDAKLRIFEESAHMSMLEEPDAYADTVREFLRAAEASNP